MKPKRSMDGCDGFVCETGQRLQAQAVFSVLTSLFIQCWTNWCLKKVLSCFLDGTQNTSKDSVVTEVLELCWEGQGHSLLLAGINSLGVLQWRMKKCCWHWALWRQIFHSVSGIGIKIGAQMKPHVGKGAFAQESKLLWKMFYPKCHNHDLDFKSIKDHLWSLDWPAVQPTCPARAVHQRSPAYFQLSSMDRPQQCGRQGKDSWAQKCLCWTCPFCLWCVSVSQQTWWAAGLWMKSFSHRDNASVSICFGKMTTTSDKFCSGYHSSFFNSWEAEKLSYCFF